jgi:transposase
MSRRSTLDRNRINVLGAINPLTQELFHIHNTDKINAEVVMDFLRRLRRRYTELPISIVLDNARYQHCKAVQELAQELDIDLLFLPPYSPNLNLIERLWKLVKKQVLYARYFENPMLFHQAIITFCEQINGKQKHKPKTLLNFKFQMFDKPTIYQV